MKGEAGSAVGAVNFAQDHLAKLIERTQTADEIFQQVFRVLDVAATVHQRFESFSLFSDSLSAVNDMLVQPVEFV